MAKNYREDITEQLIALIEKGQAPWQKPWDPTKASHTLEMPHNAVTGRPYRGGNALYLMAKGMSMGNDPRWCTYKQAQDNGWQVKKGSKGTGVEYWKFDETIETTNPDTGEKEKLKVKTKTPSVFYATVFHASQIEGIPEYTPPVRDQATWNPVEQAEAILTHSGAKIYHDQQDRAFYRPSADEIHLPPKEAFPEALNYYETALHELAHWTGHESRLNRSIMNSFGSENYAKEELRAEIASLFLSIETGVPFNPGSHGGINIDNTAAYVKSWSKKLREDKNEIFKAAKDAEGITDYVLGLAREKEISNSIEPEAKMKHLFAGPKDDLYANSYDTKADFQKDAARLLQEGYQITSEKGQDLDKNEKYFINAVRRDPMKYTAIENHHAELASSIINRDGTWSGLKSDQEIAGKMLTAGFDKTDITETIRHNSPSINTRQDLEQYLNQLRQHMDKTQDILQAKPGKGQPTANQDYKTEGKKIIKREGHFPGEKADIEIGQILMGKGHEKTRVQEAIKKNSPEIANKPLPERKQYLKDIMTKIVTPEIQKQMRSLANQR